jgi:transcriptional regulator with XRE-family HTH domain
MMTYAAVIEELRRRSGLGVNEFADAIGFSRPHLSHVLSGSQKGSVKMLEAALSFLHIAIEDCIVLPLNEGTKTEDQVALETMRKALALGGVAQEIVLAFADSIQARILETRPRKKKPKKPPGRLAMGGRGD